MKVLSVTSECAPLVKTGGLADVAGALPGALAQEGIEMRTLLPGYRDVMARLKEPETLHRFKTLQGAPARILAERVEGVDLLVLDAPHLFDRAGSLYLSPAGEDWPDNAERFAALSRAAADIAAGALADWQPDIVHAHDWQAALAPYYMRNGAVPSIMTIHNIAFQGLAPAKSRAKLGIDKADFTPEGLEYWGEISALKAGLTFATKLTTVSPSYAEELMEPHFGMGLDGVLRKRRDDLSGVLNGIDTGVWNPATDPLIKPFKTPRGKKKNKALLRDAFDLPEAQGPLCIVISRMTEQKGLDLLLEALPVLTSKGGQLALLGTGSPELETAFQELAARELNVSVKITYDESLAHKMIAGGDAILVPSRFEPCGLTQLMGLAYGTVPLVALTGGLRDTVISASHAALARGVATGLQCLPGSVEALRNALAKLCLLYADPITWAQIARNAMAHPVGWESSAKEYANLYRSMKAA
ncbi:MAG: glycogen synthase GlgA [Pseudomonadota bacterium]